MRSRHEETPATNRPRVSGESGYGALLSGSAKTNTAVTPELEYTSQRQWIQGALSSSGSSNTTAAPQKASGDKGSGISRGSAIRSGATSSGRGRSRR
jgi:hypothetical protein